MKILFLLLIGGIIISCSADSMKSNEYTCIDGCQDWEYCNILNNTCEIDKDSNSCNKNSDCYDNYKCNTSSHKCELKSNNCTEECSSWESCQDGFCLLKEGSCYFNYDCKSENNYCNIGTHQCMELDNLCDLDCNSWENCIINDENEKKCIIKNNFKWKKLDIRDENNTPHIYNPIGVALYGYNPSKNTIVNYFFKENNFFSIGKIDLNLNLQTKNILTMDSASIINNFCENDVSKCQLITYNKIKEKFMILALDSKSMLYVNDTNITEILDVEGEYPQKSISSASYFNPNGNILFLYNNMDNDISSELYTFNSDKKEWNLEMEELPNLLNNCLVSDEVDVYSFGGVINYDIDEDITNNYKININDKTIDVIETPEEFGYRSSISCTYDNKRELIFIYAGSKILDDYNEINNIYYNDLWSFSPKTKEWKLVLKNIDNGSFLPINENGYREYDADIEKPNFGKNMGKMIYDEVKDRLIIMGEVPSTKGIQIYTLKL